ncbi:MAG: beta-propeller domain-containing protein, partial [Actinobacteria bacterium]|nr:beta-propeller domain-containing protein [Actinomycetota bacterium]
SGSTRIAGAAGSARGSAAASNAGSAPQAAPDKAAAAGPSQAGLAAPGSYSGTNTATPGVDEPDLVKTDGRRIVTISGGVLRVVNAQTQQLSGELDLAAGGQFTGWTPANLLLSGDHALVLFSQNSFSPGDAVGTPGVTENGTGVVGSPVSPSPGTVLPIAGPQLALIDLSTGTPRVISQYTMDGSLVDARQIGSVARVVVQSAPRFYPEPYVPSGQSNSIAPTAAIARAGINQWLPRYSETSGAVTRTGAVSCASLSHPAAAFYTGDSMLTVLTFDLSHSVLGDGEPVTIVADGNTVYSDGTGLYIASREWVPQPLPGPRGGTVSNTGITDVTPIAGADYTGLYKFDVSSPGRPVYQASGSVPGWLLGSAGTAQYSLSAWNGGLRVATTSAGTFTAGSEQGSQSAVYVLQQSGSQLSIVGKAGGIGAGEQIYAVRFAGPVGYVVTFRQTDPLYTLDLSDPAQPRVVGQLPLRGYSAYLYPVDATHLIGIGQNANDLGQTTGTQISLFDVSDLAAPVRLSTFDVQLGHSEAEFDPHAFLYWPASKLLVIPVQLPSAVPSQPNPPVQPGPPGPPVQPVQPSPRIQPGGTMPIAPISPVSEAVVLHVGGRAFTEMGAITHPITVNDPAGGQIRRSLIINNALWTLSDAGLKANDAATLAPLAWVPFN